MSTNEDNKQKKFFYGWVIVAVCLLVQAIPFGVGSNLPPTFINYVVKAEGFSFASFSLVFTADTGKTPDSAIPTAIIAPSPIAIYFFIFIIVPPNSD